MCTCIPKYYSLLYIDIINHINEFDKCIMCDYYNEFTL